MPTTFPRAIKRSILESKHPEYCGEYCRRLRGLYEGGKSLLQDPSVLAQVFPRHMNELMPVYNERCARAVYIAHPSEIVDFITSSLAADPIRMKAGESQELDEWYKLFVDDVSPPGGDKISLASFTRYQATEMLTTKTVWARVDLPRPGEFANLEEQERAGALDAYVLPVPAECVIDWRDGPGGELEWLIVQDTDVPRASFTGSRDTIVETWTIWTRDGFAKYQVARKIGQKEEPDRDVLIMSGDGAEGQHSFGRVPFVRTTLPKGLWAMDTLESPAREHLNLRSGLAWSMHQNCQPQLYEMLAPEDGTAAAPVSEAQQDADRAVNQKRGPGYAQVRGKDDKVAFVAPPSEPYKIMLETLDGLRRNMNEVMHMMAMSVEQNKTALGRSAASKREDRASTDVVLTALGQYVREHITGIFEMVSRGRADKAYIGKWKAEGASQFKSDNADTVIDRAAQIQTVEIKSPTAQRMIQLDTFKAWAGERGTADIVETVEGELKANITAESMEPSVPPRKPPELDDIDESATKPGNDRASAA